MGSISGLGRFPWWRESLPTPVFWPTEFHGLYSPWGGKELDMTEWLSLSILGVFPFSTFFCESLVVSLLNSQNPKDIIAPPCADNGATWPLVHLPDGSYSQWCPGPDTHSLEGKRPSTPQGWFVLPRVNRYNSEWKLNKFVIPRYLFTLQHGRNFKVNVGDIWGEDHYG